MKYSKQNIKRRIFTQSHLKGNLFPDSFLEVCLLTLSHKCLFQENNSDLGQRRFKERTQIKDFLEQGDIVSLGYLAQNTGQVFRRFLSFCFIQGHCQAQQLSILGKRQTDLRVFVLY